MSNDSEPTPHWVRFTLARCCRRLQALSEPTQVPCYQEGGKARRHPQTRLLAWREERLQAARFPRCQFDEHGRVLDGLEDALGYGEAPFVSNLAR
jgi:hypothetical protein